METIVRSLQASDYAEIVLVGKNAAPEVRKSFKQKLQSFVRFGPFEKYSQWDYQRYKAEHDAFESVDLSSLLASVPTRAIVPLQKGFTDRFRPEDVAAIKAAELDVIIRFGFRIIRGEILSSAKYGVWSLHHDDNRSYRGAPPLFWEIYERNPVSGSILQILTDSLDGGKVIYRSLSATHMGSLYLNRNPIYWKSAEFLLRRLHDLYQHGWEFVTSLPTYTEKVEYKRPIFYRPRALRTANFLLRIFSQKVLAKAKEVLLGMEEPWWFVALRRFDPGTTPSEKPSSYRVLPCPQDRFYADPMLIDRKGKTFLFLEDFRYQTNKGLVSFCEINDQGEAGQLQVALERPYHLSYPFLFEWNGEVWMMPETQSNRTIELYRAASFPFDWRLEKTLFDNVDAVDSTICFIDNRFWLFTNMARPGWSLNDELHVFFADSPLGPWKPHPLNPVVSDVTAARPAGSIFFDGKDWIRPAQDCSVRYGYSVVFNRIDTLTESQYAESPVSKLGPEWRAGNRGTHTYSRSKGFEVIDGHFFRRRRRSAR